MFRNLALALAATAGIAQAAAAATITFVVQLDRLQEVGGGDPDGTGTATLMIDDVADSISWNIVVSNITLPPTGAHIHNAAAGVNGQVKIDFSGQLGAPVPEPASLALLVAAASSLTLARRRR